MSLYDYVTTRSVICQTTHKDSCTICEPLLNVARMILTNGHLQLSHAFKNAYRTQAYKTDIALVRLLQMPLVCIKPHQQNIWFLCELVEGVDYVKFLSLTDALFSFKAKASPSISKSEVNAVMTLAQSDREQQLIRYSIFKASGMSYTAAKNHYGFSNIKSTKTRILNAIEETRGICEAIYEPTHTADKALLLSLGLHVQESDSDSDSSSEVETESAVNLPTEGELYSILERTKYNWFEVVQHVENCSCGCITENPPIMSFLGTVFHSILDKISHSENKCLLEQSYNACVAALELQKRDNRAASAFNGEVVSESESDAVVDTNLSSHETRCMVARKRRNLLQRFRRKKARLIAERRYLSRSVSKRTQTIIDRHPNIGDEIEAFVRSNDVGADRWRRTGVLMFDGNVRVGSKVTFRRIKEDLESIYHEKISYGTTVQLCVACNRRHRSASNYLGVARVTSRRARKGFSIKYNPDTHWSGAFYRNLDFVQYKYGTNVCIINRDDAAGFRLDTFATNSQHRTLVVDGKQTLTTHTDYVNKYPSILQTACYNFTGTDTTAEMCAGIVKPAKIFPKNPAQHYSDLKMLCSLPEFEPVFTNNVSQTPKQIECVRVDGAGDEGPSHLEMQFWWTRRHLEEKKAILAVTSHSSGAGASYLNRVELQNGCLALAHANLFIPSTLHRMPVNPDTGDIDEDRLRCNLNKATDIYIQRVNQCPCGDTVVNLYRGSDSSCFQAMRNKLQIFLKGSKKNKDELCKNEHQLFSYFNEVWKVRNNHYHKELPTQYIFCSPVAIVKIAHTLYAKKVLLQKN